MANNIGRKFWETLAIAENIAVVLTLSGTIFCGTLQVVGRYLIASPIPWTEEMARYFMIWTVFISAVIAVRDDQHVVLDYFIKIFSERYRKLYSAVVCLIVIFIIILTLPGSIKMLASSSTTASPILRLDLSYIYLAWPVSAVFMIVHLLNYIFTYIHDFITYATRTADSKN